MNKGCLVTLGVVLLLATAGLGYYFSQQNKKVDEKIEFEKPTIDDIIEKSVATGTILPRQEVDIKPQVSGVVDQVYVEEGDIVRKGQKLAKIKLIPSEVSINSAQSNVQLAKIRYDESRREKERQQKIYSNNLDVENAKLSYQNAEKESMRQQELFEQGVISQQELDRINLDMNIKKAALDNASIASNNSLRQFESDVLIKQQEYESALNNLQLLREGVTNNSRQVSNVIKSTLDGMILDVPVKEGSSVVERNNFNEGTSIATIANMGDLIFEGKVDEADVGKLRTGMPITLTVGALSDEVFDAILEHISPKGNEEEGAVKFGIKASITPRDSIFLRAGYSANGDVILNQRDQVVTINERDIIFKGDTTYVEIKTGNLEFEEKEIEIGISDGVRTEVVSGLDTTQAIRKQVVIDKDDI